MGLFSRKSDTKGQETETLGKIPKVLPDTLMQKLSSSKQPDSIIPRKIYTEDIKTNLKAKEAKAPDEHKRIPESIANEHQGKGPERHEIEKVLMMKKDFDNAARELRSADLPSFFAELERRIFAKGISRKHLVSQDIMSRLKDYHDSIGSGKPFFLHELEIEEEIAKSLASLKEIETEWLMSKRNVSLAEKLLYEKESELEKRLELFRGLLSSSEKHRMLNMPADDSRCFFLVDGTRISSLQELINALPNMKDEVFSYHVNEEKNDFSTWVSHVFGFVDLSSRMLSAKNKSELLELLRNC